MTSGRVVAAVGLIAAAAALAACSSSAGSKPSTSPPSSQFGLDTTTVSSMPSSTPTLAPSTPEPSTTTTSASRTVTATKTAQPDVTPFVTTCTKLTTRIIPGGAVRGAEIAAVQYTNDGSGPCTISGYPKLVLLQGGKKIGTPSQPSGKPVKQFMLKPGDVGESLVRDFSTCNAPLAEHARVTVPGRTEGDSTTVVRPVKLRACILRVDPVGPPA